MLLTANIIGAVTVALLITFVFPGLSVFDRQFRYVSFVVVPVFVAVAFVVSAVVATIVGLRSGQWATDEEVPTPAQQRATLALPWHLTVILGIAWALGGIVVTTAYGVVDVGIVPKVGLTVLFGGATVSAYSYLLAEFGLRPLAAQALIYGRPNDVPGVQRRAVLSWLLGTAVPVTGMLVLLVFTYFKPISAERLVLSMFVLAGITLGCGFLLTVLGAQATVHPIRAVTHAMAELERGDVTTRVVVYDGTELGQLQSGFNRMAVGLEERERIRDLFGRHVGRDVAAAALREHPELGGEERTVAALFVDIVGSTRLAAQQPPQAVVALLNQFFDVVVGEVDAHGGFVNKFEGDGALAVFGAPAHIADPAACALAAARAIHRRLPTEVPGCDAALGVSYGVAVAGNIGARDRFEYTVIGDPVNEAARLCELAKTAPGRLLASDATVMAAANGEGKQWTLDAEVELRGRGRRTRLAIPAADS